MFERKEEGKEERKKEINNNMENIRKTKIK